jgi:hypothetical protein
MHLRSVLVAAAAAVAVVGTAGPALAHEEINPKTFPTGQPTFFTLTAANETANNLVKIVLHAPSGVAFGETTRSPVGWSAARTADTITWTGGAVKPDTFDSWGFEIDGADQPGTLAYKVTLSYAHPNGDVESDTVEVDVNAVAPGAAAGGGNPAGGSTGTVATGAATPTTGAAGAVSDRGATSDGASGTAKAALAVAIVALLVAAGALAVSGRRRSGPAGPGTGAGGAAQDW